MIKTKSAQVVPFQPNAVQEAYLDELCPLWRAGIIDLTGKQEILLKARQFGFSTLILALFFLQVVNYPNVKAVVIAHDSDSTEGLFEMVTRFYDELDPALQPPTKYSSKRVLQFADNHSSLSVMTAGAKTSGRSKTIHFLHCSEAAFWRHKSVLTGLLQAVPSSGCTFQETTANGEGNQFWVDYQAAKAGESTFTPRFFAWYQHTEYRIKPPSDFERVTEASEPRQYELFGNEQAMAEKYGLDDAQLYWRRRKILEPGMGSLFRQEYPSNDVEAFLVSGSKFFTEWNDDHAVIPHGIPPYWKFIGGLDWGFGAPFCFLLGAVDDIGNVIIVDEVYKPRLQNKEQAEAVTKCLEKWGFGADRAKVVIAADPSMWAKKNQHDGIGRADIEEFWSAGLNMVQANNNRQHGWSNMRRYLAAPGALTIFKGACPNLIRTLPVMVHDSKKIEDIDTELEDHAVDTLRYLLNQRVRPTGPDPEAVAASKASAPRFLQNARKRTYI